MKLTLITGPAETPVSVSEAKAHLRVDITADDALIEESIKAATKQLEDELGRAFVTQTHELVLDSWPGGRRMMLPRPRLQSVTSVTYVDVDGSSAVLASSNYLVDTDGEPGGVVLKNASSWPSVALQEVNGIRVRFVAGYGLAATVPSPIKKAILLIIGTWYENREGVQVAQGIAVTELPHGVNRLIKDYRVRT